MKSLKETALTGATILAIGASTVLANPLEDLPSNLSDTGRTYIQNLKVLDGIQQDPHSYGDKPNEIYQLRFNVNKGLESGLKSTDSAFIKDHFKADLGTLNTKLLNYAKTHKIKVTGLPSEKRINMGSYGASGESMDKQINSYKTGEDKTVSKEKSSIKPILVKEEKLVPSMSPELSSLLGYTEYAFPNHIGQANYANAVDAKDTVLKLTDIYGKLSPEEMKVADLAFGSSTFLEDVFNVQNKVIKVNDSSYAFLKKAASEIGTYLSSGKKRDAKLALEVLPKVEAYNNLAIDKQVQAKSELLDGNDDKAYALAVKEKANEIINSKKINIDKLIFSYMYQRNAGSNDDWNAIIKDQNYIVARINDKHQFKIGISKERGQRSVGLATSNDQADNLQYGAESFNGVGANVGYARIFKIPNTPIHVFGGVDMNIPYQKHFNNETSFGFSAGADIGGYVTVGPVELTTGFSLKGVDTKRNYGTPDEAVLPGFFMGASVPIDVKNIKKNKGD